MEDGPDIGSSTDRTKISSPTSIELNNGDTEMANFPTVDNSSPTKVNGETSEPIQSADEPTIEHRDEERDSEKEREDKSSDCDNLIIDESQEKPKRKKKHQHEHNKVKDHHSEQQQHQHQQQLLQQQFHSNPYFAESIFELTNHYNTSQVEGIPKLSLKKVGNRYAKKVRGKNGKPKLREYAQYLGLQPTVQFKCSKCGSAGFESLQLLNEHLINCTAIAPINQPPAVSNNSSTNFKVTRKVFLCSACGTYYENWNLFLHMREVHKRFICLYCLGMFPHAEKLSVHLIAKHNCAPQRHETESDFFNTHKEPCFVMCCDCQMVFNEQDHFTRHKCIDNGKGLVPVKTKNSERVHEDVQVTTNQIVIETSCGTKDGEVSLTGTVTLTNHEHEEAAKLTRAEDEPETVDNCNENVLNSGDMNDNVTPLEGEETNDTEQDKSDLDLNDTIHSEELLDGINDIDDNEPQEHEPRDEDVDADENDRDDNDEEDDNDNEQMCIDDSADEIQPQPQEEAVVVEERKVPKVTLKLKLPVFNPAEEPEEPDEPEDEDEYQSDDSEKLMMEVDKDNAVIDDNQSTINDDEHIDVEGHEDVDVDQPDEHNEQELADIDDVSMAEEAIEFDNAVKITVPTAGLDVVINEIELEQPLDKFDIKLLLQKCLQATIPTCLYCNHARKIHVNGKQLGLHAIAEHRYAAIVKSITAEELIPESFNTRIQESLEGLESAYFNLEDSTDSGGVTFSHLFECFQCRYSSTVHKELYVHNRKLHAKSVLLCIMCKTSFYSYSELLCHLCPGVYSSGRDVQFRCCLCVSDDIPSAFRLMVHLRKKHHVCDVCLDVCHNEARLSNHVWKHKLHHLCYRCGIAYRNKPDITKHLFWKHGTESVECKRCLQKKWPHVYHFCMPPTSFPCDECNLLLTSASKLKVHKRLHAEEFPYACTEEDCTDKFISKKLLAKHEARHRQPFEEPKEEEEEEEIIVQELVPEKIEEVEIEKIEPIEEPVKEEEKPKPKVDVFDLPELNLSESDSSDSEDESMKSTKTFKPEETLVSTVVNTDDLILETSQDDILKLPDDFENSNDTCKDITQILDDLPPTVSENTVLDIWDNFKNYQANIAKNILTDVGKELDDDLPEILTYIPPPLTLEDALRDHDYCPRTTDTLNEHEGIPMGCLPTAGAPENHVEQSADHDYCTAKETKPAEDGVQAKEDAGKVATKAAATAKTDSSSDSNSTSCTCGSNCSCSSSSDSSSSSSDSSESDSSSEEGRRKQQVRREKRRGKKAKKASGTENPVEVVKVTKDEPQNQIQKPSEVAPPPVPKETPIRDSDLETTESDTDEEFYDKEPQKLANKILAEKREKLMQMAALGPYLNGSMIDSRPATPTMPEQTKSKKKSKSKKKKKKKSSKRQSKTRHIPIPSYPTVAPLTLTIPKNSPSVVAPIYNSPMHMNNHVAINNTPLPQTPVLSESDSASKRASKRRRVPNKFYGYSSDDEGHKSAAASSSITPIIKFRKVDLPSPKPVLVVPPITIKTTPNSTPVVDPISIRVSTKPGEMRVQPLRLPIPKRNRPPPKPKAKRLPPIPQPRVPPLTLPTPASLQRHRDNDSGTDSNSTTSDAEDEAPIPTPSMPPPPKPNQPALYCYCRCPYDEVSEMIGCDSDDCAIEWFHFECVGIMVPPKGQWFCPDCRKRKQQRREMLQAQVH